MSTVIGIVAATRWEIKPWLATTGSKPAGQAAGGGVIFRGILDGNVIVTVIGGIGMESAKKATQNLITTHQPAVIFSVGFAGSLIPDLKTGDFVIEGRDKGLDLVALGMGKETGWVRIGHVASAKEVLETPRKKQDFHKQTKADAVDMEWSGVKAAAREAGVLCAAVKIISDASQEKIPLPKGLRHHTGQLSGLRAFKESLKDPFSLPKTIWFGTRSAKLSKNLAKFLKAFVISTSPIAEKAGHYSQGADRVKTCQ